MAPPILRRGRDRQSSKDAAQEEHEQGEGMLAGDLQDVDPMRPDDIHHHQHDEYFDEVLQEQDRSLTPRRSLRSRKISHDVTLAANIEEDINGNDAIHNSLLSNEGDEHLEEDSGFDAVGVGRDGEVIGINAVAATYDKAMGIRKGKPRGKYKTKKDKDINYTVTNYYHRYKNQDYVKKNDISKYCHVCKKKTIGKFRHLPCDLRLRRQWILHFNLDRDQAAEMWVKDNFSQGTHCGETCEQHFPPGTHDLRTKDVLPIDMRPMSKRRGNDDMVDFDLMELICVMCGTKDKLRNMIPFVKTRAKRHKWIESLAQGDDAQFESLTEQLKGGATRFLCDWHFSDHDFDINSFGEWKLKKDCLPDPALTPSDKLGNRIYIVDHTERNQLRSMEYRHRKEEYQTVRKEVKLKERIEREQYKIMAQKLRRTYPKSTAISGYSINLKGKSRQIQPTQRYSDELVFDMSQFRDNDQDMVKREPDAYYEETEEDLQEDGETTLATTLFDYSNVEFSDDSDEENMALQNLVGEPPLGGARFCQVCHRIISSDKSIKEFHPRTWPFDDVKHDKWLEIMNWPHDFEESMRVLWIKRRNDYHSSFGSGEGKSYHYCPINVCQNHLDYRELHAKVDAWLQVYCVLCDEVMSEENQLLPFPVDRIERVLWMQSLFSGHCPSRLMQKRWDWLRNRLTRPRATRYKICVFHFSQDCFLEKEDMVGFIDTSLPLPMSISEYEPVPRGPYGLMKCPLCDFWSTESAMTEIRIPNTQPERMFLSEVMTGDKNSLRKGVDQLAKNACKICKTHTNGIDPYALIAERKLVRHREVQCLQCSARDVAPNMIPFPFDEEKREQWVEALCRDYWGRARLAERLQQDGRHYLCAIHFHKNALRFIPGLGIWKRFVYLPIAVKPNEREKLLMNMKDTYRPLVIPGIDDNGVVQDLTYDEVCEFLGETSHHRGHMDDGVDGHGVHDMHQHHLVHGEEIILEMEQVEEEIASEYLQEDGEYEEILMMDEGQEQEYVLAEEQAHESNMVVQEEEV